MLSGPPRAYPSVRRSDHAFLLCDASRGGFGQVCETSFELVLLYDARFMQTLSDRLLRDFLVRDCSVL